MAKYEVSHAWNLESHHLRLARRWLRLRAAAEAARREGRPAEALAAEAARLAAEHAAEIVAR